MYVARQRAAAPQTKALGKAAIRQRRRFRQAVAGGYVAAGDVGEGSGARARSVARAAARALPKTALGYGEEGRKKLKKLVQKESSIFSAGKARAADDGKSPFRGELFRSHRLLNKREEFLLGTKIQELMRILEAKAQLDKERGESASLSELAAQLGTDERELLKRIDHGEKCKRCLTNANMRLVASVAKKYTHHGLEMADLVSEGAKGLVRGVEKFDPEKGYRFSTYASWWIRQAVHRAVQEKARDIRVPSHVYELVSKARGTEKALLKELNRAAGPAGTERLSLPVEVVAKEMGIPTVKLVKAFRAIEKPVRLDAKKATKSKDGEAVSLGDQLIEPHEPSPEAISLDHNMTRDVNAVLNTLTAREKVIICHRYGIGADVLTLQEIGNKLSLTRERVRQIEQKALRKLRHPSRAEVLNEYTSQTDFTWDAGCDVSDNVRISQSDGPNYLA